MRRRHVVLGTVVGCCGMLVAVMAVASPPRGGAVYEGETSQDRTVRFRVTPEGDLIQRFRINRDLVCRRGKRRSGLTGRFKQTSGTIRVPRSGRFHGEIRVEGRGASRIRGGTACIRGTFRRKGKIVRGRYREVVRLRDGSLCRSGLVTFIARAQ